MRRKLLLISNTKVANGKKLAHARDNIVDLLGDRKSVTFIPYANPSGIGYEKYFSVIKPIFREMGYELKLIDELSPFKSIHEAEALFAGGGNTWEFLKKLKDKRLLYSLRESVGNGTPYIGSSAGSNIAGLTIGNTNDMPSAECYGRHALGLVPFNINPHYHDTIELSSEEREAILKIVPRLKIVLDHQGETRDDRLYEYHALGNIETVVALREGAMLRVEDDHIYLKGSTGAKLFRPNQEPEEINSNANLDFLLKRE